MHALGKGVHYFDAAGRGAAWYRLNFPVVLRLGRDDPARAPFLTGEASPEYLPHPGPRPRRRAGARCPPPGGAARPCGPGRLHYHHSRALGTESLLLREALAAKRSAWPASWRGSRADPRADSVALRHHAYVTRSRYAEQLACWLALFPREQLLAVRFEDLVADPPAVLDRVFAFLGLPPAPSVTVRRLNARRYDDVPGVRAALRAELAPAEDDLERLLGPGFRWAT